jgi:hypothetical protein
MKAKHILFWVMFIPFALWMVIFGTLAGVFHYLSAGFDWLANITHYFEAWCFDYAKNHKHLGDGIWTNKDNKEL